MTRIVIAAFGTRGDVAPLTGLGAKLQTYLGVEVAVAAQQSYGQMIASAGLRYEYLPKDTEQATRDSVYGQGVVDGSGCVPPPMSWRKCATT